MEKIEEKINKALESKVLVRILLLIGILIIAILIFSAGISVGFHKAAFGRAWGEHYYENFGISDHRFLDIGPSDDFPSAHGAAGKIIKTNQSTVIVTEENNIEKIVLITDDTKIEKGRVKIQPSELQIDDFIVVVGSPNNQGQIEAKLIRVMPSPKF